MNIVVNLNQLTTFLSTHPATSDRIAALRSAINSQKAYRGGGLNNAAYEAKIQPLS
ncbi:hypothetical protein IQ229_07055 [Nostoc cf. edaphicum LEGE 07299]|uniref:Peptidase M48 Ste24p n=1 Tax=Nostoc cf. edaphicum LEGE 07299 TaxID=2777974 RepID=A0ABR9TWB8_9NOSO|nr:hypothetical protein [Nostoc cf. edaphicum LEGE 07299]